MRCVIRVPCTTIMKLEAVDIARVLHDREVRDRD